MKYYKLYDRALGLFEKGEYKACIEILTSLYNARYFCEEIKEFVYTCFIEPNQGEFQDNFKTNGRNPAEYNTCRYDFVPVSDMDYFPYDKQDDVFLDCIHFNEERKKVFGNVLFDVENDYTSMCNIMFEKAYGEIYIVNNDAKCFLDSVYKIASTASVLDCVRFFLDCNEMKQFFLAHSEIMLPKQLYGEHINAVRDTLGVIHQHRIETKQAEKGVFLSICIPSYNRGALALRGVQYILNSIYDSEIEIIVSDDASVKDREAYQQISQIQDSRLHYYEQKDNLGLAGNVEFTLKQAKGKFAVICADEDLMVIEHLDDFLDILYRDMDAGMVVSTGYGEEFRLLTGEYERYPKGLLALNYILRLNYITGWALNIEKAREHHIFEKFEELRGNHFLEYFPQMVFAMLASDYADIVYSGIALWDERYGDNQTYVGNDGSQIFYYVRPESRIMQINGCVEIVANHMHVSMDERGIFLTVLMDGFYKLSYTNARLLWRFREVYDWQDIVHLYHENNKMLLERNAMELDDFMIMYVREEEEKSYQRYLQLNPELAV